MALFESSPVPDWHELGIGGLLALMVVREVFRFLQQSGILKSKRAEDVTKTTAGERTPDYWLKVFDDLGQRIILAVAGANERNVKDAVHEMREMRLLLMQIREWQVRREEREKRN